jgi:glycosyltransferase involved in cell wall biosynthesis
MTPLVSVIIPTHNRPQFLPRAVDSALAGMPAGDVEVIVVPNGPDQSWKQSLLPYKHNSFVRVIPIPEANGNIARNAGLAAANGEFIRFLDDDDYLISEGAVKQYALIKDSGVDVVCGSIQAKNPEGKITKTYTPPNIDDFCEAVLSPLGYYLLHAYTYRKRSISGIFWDPEIESRQDYYWLFDLCNMNILKWIRIDNIVGIWQHHWEKRISTLQDINDANMKTVQYLLQIYKNFNLNNSITKGRKRSIAQSLLHGVHAAFPNDPKYWTKIAQIAKGIDPEARPIQRMYYWPILKRIDPLTIQWLLWPKRRLSQIKRKWLFKNKLNFFYK